MTKHIVRARDGLLNGTAYFGPMFMDANEALVRLENRRTELMEANQALLDAADEADIDVPDEDLATIAENKAAILKLDGQISARIQPASPIQGNGRRSTAEPQNGAKPGGQRHVPAQPRADNPRHGFQSFGTFAQTVRASYRGVENDDVTRMRNIANSTTTYGNEGTGADGGFLVPPEFSREIWQKVMAEENLLNRCAPLVTDRNSMMIPKDETTPWQTTGGVQVYWEGEAQVPANSKPTFEMGSLRLSKLFGIVPVSDELLEDASGLESWLRAKAPSKMAAKINTAIINGTGVGQPLGIIPGGTAVGNSVVQVSKATSQPADTLWMVNIEAMYSRMYAPWRRNAIWLINQDLEPQFNGMAFQANGASSLIPGTSAVPAYMQPGTLANSPYGTLKGRPVVPVEACGALGDLGDIIFVDLNQYWALTKAGGMQTDTSIHLYFDQALTAFRFIFRVNGQPAWSSTITRQNGSGNELSWAVTLQAR
ncbi:phage major capsid protein [Mesorhizobium sp. B263B2A]|uniref:phage major capsid protein n=1 Tax=Mesorhizobium sp. B263B2A TaxID=2876669 RepID=UPI001CD1918B|nr:phage major capsid protein [Mesorhizobium sp. B263B2A]MCA0032746.1 phage major capsid protein [Mesorhizobium sp. B263B2A]